MWKLPIGGSVEHDGARFTTWAPRAAAVAAVIRAHDGERTYPLSRIDGGYWEGFVPGIHAGDRYWLEVDGQRYPDPASRSQPDGVHGPSELIDPAAFRWSDTAWTGLADSDWVIYELHIGTFTPGGTFDTAIERLEHLASLGITAIEVMPIASFAGNRNWGYDGVQLYAPSACYGGPDAFRRFVDAAHRRGIGVILDVVYNHFGPEGNYLPSITGGRFFNPDQKTAWGDAINYDGDDRVAVREFVIQNALYWAHEFHVDGLRLDATHAIADRSPTHVVGEVARALHALSPRRIVIAEDERNERRLIERDGLGLDAVWADDFHHQSRRLLAGDHEGYFASFTGTIEDLATTIEKGWFYEGQWSPHTNAPRGTSAAGLPARAFVHCLQNHDQVGNRPLGDRLHDVIPMSSYRAMSALLLLSPHTPMLWMGQEWAASTPFLYFTDHEASLGALVTEGRRQEFSDFSGFSTDAARERIPDPQSVSSFEASRLRWGEIDSAPHRATLELYRALLALRRSMLSQRRAGHRPFEVTALRPHTIVLQHNPHEEGAVVVVARLSEGAPAPLDRLLPKAPPGHSWSVALSTEEQRFGGELRIRARDDLSAYTLEQPMAVVLVATRTVSAMP